MNVAALGELIIDFTQAGFSPSGNPLYERNAGGAPANLLVSVTRLGGSGAFIGKVGDDPFGHYLKDVLIQNGVDPSGLIVSGEAPTTLAFVHLEKNGERSFSFCRKPGADTLMRPDEVNLPLIDGCEIFHFGSLSMTDSPAYEATYEALKYAKGKGKNISYDPNYRRPLWSSDGAAKRRMAEGLKYADLLKVSLEELQMLTGESDVEAGAKMLSGAGIGFIAVTLGENGCYYRREGLSGSLSAYRVDAVDTTGAGDAFWGAFLYRATRPGFDWCTASKDEIEDVLDFCNAAGALCASGRGAIASLPTLADIAQCRQNIDKRTDEA